MLFCSTIPESGGEYIYIQRAFGDLPASAIATGQIKIKLIQRQINAGKSPKAL
jgi:amino acid transporter